MIEIIHIFNVLYVAPSLTYFPGLRAQWFSLMILLLFFSWDVDPVKNAMDAVQYSDVGAIKFSLCLPFENSKHLSASPKPTSDPAFINKGMTELSYLPRRQCLISSNGYLTSPLVKFGGSWQSSMITRFFKSRVSRGDRNSCSYFRDFLCCWCKTVLD